MSKPEASGEDELEMPRARPAEIDRDVAGPPGGPRDPDAALKERLDLLKTVLDSCTIYVYAKDAEGRYLVTNKLYETFLKSDAKSILGKTDEDFFSKEDAALYRSYDRRVLAGETTTSEDNVTYEGQVLRLLTAKSPLRDSDGKIYATCSVTADISELRAAESRNRKLQEEMLRLQAETLRALSTPLLPIARGVVLMPLLGHLDKARAREILDKLLEGVSTSKASIVILDVTGLQMNDVSVAGMLLHAAKAVKLLGAEVVLTGIQPASAGALVELGVELQGVTLRSTLESGIAYALSRV